MHQVTNAAILNIDFNLYDNIYKFYKFYKLKMSLKLITETSVLFGPF